MQRAISLLTQGQRRQPHALQRLLQIGNGSLRPRLAEASQRAPSRRAGQQRQQLRQFGLRMRRQRLHQGIDPLEQAIERNLTRALFLRQTLVQHCQANGRKHFAAGWRQRSVGLQTRLQPGSSAACNHDHGCRRQPQLEQCSSLHGAKFLMGLGVSIERYL